MLNGAKIRELRLNKSLTSKDLSTLSKNLSVHVSQTYLEELERGSKQNPSFNIIETIATILCVNIDELRRI
ncbi:helix-turn-helix domain-containing protein [Clostridium estertheticum]|uniref:helix-turn-helix domain-containing protein n=1 Tax=Clostridium estertheticum TaxID=238834 RepID=UPI001CF50C67|nr:helix-turn-helix transcriptional regulator [Clostridium estertheticum]MCB2343024.1 helix-turn-helix domain-containing protein [Clostridium estertheticum]